MFPSEMVILMAIAASKDAGEKLLDRPTDITGEYIGYLYDSLVKRGYLKENSLRGYQLTPAGRKSLLEFLYKNKTGVKATVRRLQQIGIAISQEQVVAMGRLGKEVAV